MRLNAIALALGLAAMHSMPAFSVEQAPTGGGPLAVLIAQGKYWQAHRRGDLAEQAWQKVLSVAPDQPDALYGMGIVLADRKDASGAQQYLARLRSVAPQYPQLDELGRRLGERSARDETVDYARQLAQSGQSAAAAQQYARALTGAPASPQLRLEYYQALASTPQGWDKARSGLKALAAEHPDDPRFALAYAQHLTYRDTTRREGIGKLAALAEDATVGAAARKSWRQALLWLGARPSDGPLYESYFKVAGEDATVKARYDAMVRQTQDARVRAERAAAASARGRALAAGYAALDRGDLTAASKQFSAVLDEAPQNSDALGGLGIVALRRERFAQARNYLERAVAHSASAARWKDALTSATYWADTSAAIGARSNGEFAKAKRLFERAITENPSDVTAQVQLGEMLLANGNARAAEQAYRMALRRQADNPDAIRGLVGALAAQGRGDEALAFAQQLTAEQQAKAGGADRLRGTARAAQARAAEARGDFGRARSLLEDALLATPDDPWLRLDLARIYVREGALANATSMMDGLIATHPDMVDARYAGALLAAQTHEWAKGLALLEGIPVHARTHAMAVLQRRLWLHRQAALATRLARTGNKRQALATLAAARDAAGNDPELIGTLAQVYAQAGEPRRAIELARVALDSSPGNPGLLLQYAGILLNARADWQLGAVMRELSAMRLTTDQRSAFDKINLAIVVRQTDATRGRGDLAGAYDRLSPWLAALPDDPDLQAALARLYASAGEDAHALGCYRVALERRPDDSGLLTAALAAATSTKDFDYAQTLANRLLRVMPNDPGALATVGRLYRAEGRLSLAATYLRRSLYAARTPPLASSTGEARGAGKLPPNWAAAMSRIGAPLPGTNPFEGKSPVVRPARAMDDAPPPDAYAPAAARVYPSSSQLTRTVPHYLPPLQPAGYAASYTVPYAAPAAERVAGMATNADDDYGPAAYGTSESGAPARAPRYVQDEDAYSLTPWPTAPVTPTAQADIDGMRYTQLERAQARGTGGGSIPATTRGDAHVPTKSALAARGEHGRQRDARRTALHRRTQYAGRIDRPGDEAPTYRAYPQRTYVPQDTYMPQRSNYVRRQYSPRQYAPLQYVPQQYASQQYAPQQYAPQQYAPRRYAPQEAYGGQQEYVPQPDAMQRRGLAQPDYVPRPPAVYAQADEAAGYADAGPEEPAHSERATAAPAPSVADELAQIDQEQASTVTSGLVFRNREGEDGLSTLTDIEAPVEGRIKAGNGHVVVTATPVTLDAGTASNLSTTLSRFGTGLATSASAYGGQNASGVGLSLGYETRALKLDVGVTPLGFVEKNVVGGLRYRGGLSDKVTYSLAVARRAVTDSMLSYAGVRYGDSTSGKTAEWGGVTSNGARTSLTWDDGTSGAYVNAAFQYYQGKNVATNNAVKGGGGFYTRLYKDGDQTLTVGTNATLMRYARNLSYFTYGQGGYFSPQQYVILNLPVEWTGRKGALSYDLKGSIGIQHFRLSQSDYFPLGDALSGFANANDKNSPNAGNVYPGMSKTGFAYSLKAAAEYRFAQQLALGAMASLGNAYQYREWTAAVYVRYSFTKDTAAPTFPPTPISSPYLSLDD